MAETATQCKEREYGMCGPLGAMIAATLQFLALFFMVLGTPYDVFRLKYSTPSGYNCYSVWGRKRCGGAHPGARHDEMYLRCGAFEASMKAAASFCIISIAAILILFILIISYLTYLIKGKLIIVLFFLFTILCTCIPWPVVAGLYHNQTCRVRFKDIANYAPGFPFLIIPFCLEIISFIFFCIV